MTSAYFILERWNRRFRIHGYETKKAALIDAANLIRRETDMPKYRIHNRVRQLCFNNTCFVKDKDGSRIQYTLYAGVYRNEKDAQWDLTEPFDVDIMLRNQRGMTDMIIAYIQSLPPGSEYTFQSISDRTNLSKRQITEAKKNSPKLKQLMESHRIHGTWKWRIPDETNNAEVIT